MKYAMSALLAVVLLAGADGPDAAVEEKPNPDGALKAHYHRFVLLRYEGNVVALHLLPDPARGWDGVHYRWYHLADGTDRFYRPTPAGADASPNPALKSGAGETHEGVRAGKGDITAGPLAFPWSKSGLRSGYLYLAEAGPGVEVYPVQFERLEDCSGKLDAKRWMRVAGRGR